MIFSDLPSPAEASSRMPNQATGFAQVENRYTPPIGSGQAFSDHAFVHSA